MAHPHYLTSTPLQADMASIFSDGLHIYVGSSAACQTNEVSSSVYAYSLLGRYESTATGLNCTDKAFIDSRSGVIYGLGHDRTTIVAYDGSKELWWYPIRLRSLPVHINQVAVGGDGDIYVVYQVTNNYVLVVLSPSGHAIQPGLSLESGNISLQPWREGMLALSFGGVLEIKVDLMKVFRNGSQIHQFDVDGTLPALGYPESLFDTLYLGYPAQFTRAGCDSTGVTAYDIQTGRLLWMAPFPKGPTNCGELQMLMPTGYGVAVEYNLPHANPTAVFQTSWINASGFMKWTDMASPSTFPTYLSTSGDAVAFVNETIDGTTHFWIDELQTGSRLLTASLGLYNHGVIGPLLIGRYCYVVVEATSHDERLNIYELY